mgnify:FL=1
MENVRDIAKWFLSKQSMTHKKLQKLCYYAQAWYCTLYDGSPLYKDDIEAWVHGPVIPSLYPIYAEYKWNLIPKQDFDESIFDEKVLDVLNAVYNTYGDFDGDQLEAITHREAPWKDARGDLNPLDVCHNVIACDAMRSYYGELYKQSQGE